MNYDFIPPLSQTERNTAIRLDFKTYLPATPISPLIGWDNHAYYGTSEKYAILDSTFVVNLKQGATYDFFSSSFFDPFILQLHDSTGRVIEVDQGQGSYGMDMIFDFVPQVSGNYYISASWDQGNAAAHRYVSVSVYEDLDTIPVLTPPVLPQPTPAQPQPAVPQPLPGPYLGTGGLDAVALSGNMATFRFDVDGASVHVSGNSASATYVNVERFHFDDFAVATDIGGNAGKAYRIYEAAFNRTPDHEGLGYWIDRLDDGSSLESIASEFLVSPEFQGTYGVQVPQTQFINALYNNVLGRLPDQAGADYWADQLNTGTMNRAQVLVGFSESPENQQGVIAAIQNGIQYEAWVG